MNKREFKKNVSYLEKNDVSFLGNACDDEPFSAELEHYTDAGGDMIITLDELSKESLQEYIDNFDINKEVVMWWPNGRRGNGVPFSNIRDHYDDLEEWIDSLQEICDGMPY